MIGKTLRKIREGKGLSQAAVAEVAGIHWNAVARIEREEVSPSFAAVVGILRGLRHKFVLRRKKR